MRGGDKAASRSPSSSFVEFSCLLEWILCLIQKRGEEPLARGHVCSQPPWCLHVFLEEKTKQKNNAWVTVRVIRSYTVAPESQTHLGGEVGRVRGFLEGGSIRVIWLECARLQREPRRRRRQSDVSVSLAGRRRRGSCRRINLSRNAFSPARPNVRGRAPGDSNCSFI